MNSDPLAGLAPLVDALVAARVEVHRRGDRLVVHPTRNCPPALVAMLKAAALHPEVESALIGVRGIRHPACQKAAEVLRRLLPKARREPPVVKRPRQAMQPKPRRLGATR